MPKIVTSAKENKKMRWDAKRRKWVGWQIDVYVSQGAGKRPKRHRIVYPSESAAKEAESRLRVKNENIKRGIETPDETKRVEILGLLNKRLSEIDSHREKIRAKRVFEKFLDVNAEIKFVDEIRSAHFNAFISARLGMAARASDKKIKPETLNREITPLLSALKAGIKSHKELADYVLPAIDRPKVKKQARQTNLSESDKNKICALIRGSRLKKERATRARSREPLALMFELAWFLGLRFGECRKLLKTDFNAENKTLRVVRWKTGAVTLFEFLPEQVCRLLESAAGLSSTEFVFETFASEHTLNQIIKNACEDAGLRHGIKERDGITFHSNRHSFTTRITEIADIATAQSFTSHSNAEMIAYYSHATAKKRREAMERLYGEKEKMTREKLANLFEKVRARKMKFEDFLKEFKPYFPDL